MGEDGRAGRAGRRWATGLAGLVSAAAVPVLTLSGLGLGVTALLLDAPSYAAGGVCVACAGILVERRRYYDLEDRLVRLRTRLRVARQRSDGELVELRERLRGLEREVWEYRLVDQLGPQARDLIHGMAATLARPYVPATALEHEDWDLFDTHPIDLATLQGGAGPLPQEDAEPVEPEVAAAPRRPPSPHHPEPPTIDLPVIRPGAAVIDLRSRPSGVDGQIADIRELDQRVYEQLLEAVQDELAATLQPAGQRPALGKGAAPAAHVVAAGATAVKGTANVPDDPGRRTA